MFKKVLSEQRELGTKEEIRKHLQEQVEFERKELDKLLLELDTKEAQQMQDAFVEYKRVMWELFEQESKYIDAADIEKIVPENLWAKKVLAEAEANGVDFDEMWENIQKKLREEANERAKKDTSIN